MNPKKRVKLLLLWVALFILLLPEGVFASNDANSLLSKISSIAEVRVDKNKAFVPDRLGDTVTITGRATVSSGKLWKGSLFIFIQDSTAGIAIYKSDYHGPIIKAGDSLKVSGVVNQYRGLTELKSPVITFIDTLHRRIPQPVPLLNRNPESYEGRLVTLKARIIGKNYTTGGKYLIVSPVKGSGNTFRVFKSKYSGNPDLLDKYSPGEVLQITGLFLQHDYSKKRNGYYEILPRTENDLRLIEYNTTFYLIIIGVIIFLILLSLLFIILLRRKVNKITKALNDKEIKYQTIFEATGTATIIVDLNKNILMVNQECIDIIGYSPEELIGKPWPNFVAPESLDKMLLNFKLRLENEALAPKRYEARLVRKNGKTGDFIIDIAMIPSSKQMVVSMLDITEKNNAVNALRISEERYRSLYYNTTIGLYRTNPDGRIILANPALVKMLGFASFEELASRNLEKEGFNQPYNRKQFIEQIEKEGKITGLESAWTRKDGLIIFVRESAKAIRNEKGRTLYYDGTVEDITEKKYAEQALRKSEEQFRKLFEDHAAVKLIIDPDNGNIVDANKAASKFYGWSRDELNKMNISQINSLPFEVIKQDLKKAKNLSKTYFEFRHRLKNGSVKEVAVFSSKVEWGGKTCLHSVIHDITERKRAETALKESEEKFRILYNNSPDMYVSVSPEDASIIFCNDTLLDKTGYSRDEVIGSSVYKLYHEDCMEETKITFQQFVDKGIVKNKELIIKRKDGSRIDISLNAVAVKDNQGKILYSISAWRDISERKKTEKDLIAAKEKAQESDRLKSAFLANMSHEIRTPMNGILGFTSLLEEEDLGTEVRKEYIEAIQKSGDRMLNTINAIMDISKIEASMVEIVTQAVNINHYIEDTYKFFNIETKEKEIRFSYKTVLSSEESIILSDGNKVFAILSNLIKNAIKFTNQGSIDFGYVKKDDQLEFYVKDTGMGIPKDRQQAIFERFIQADIEDKLALQGTGLGLSIVKAYVEMLGGKLWLEYSEPGKGSEFRFTLPYKPVYARSNESKPETKKEEKETSKRTTSKGLKILIAEDDEASCQYLSVILKGIAETVLYAENGKEAIEIFKANPDIDLILMDIMMPVMNGYQATRQIRTFDKDIVIIAQTAYALSGDKDKVLAAGCNGYITKPLSPNDLKAVISKYFKTKK